MIYDNAQPLVSVIVNCHNGEKYLEFAIKSIINQSYKNIEIIFYDNASTDNSKKIISKYIKVLKYFKTETKLDLGYVRQKAVEECKGKYISFLDVDDVWEDNHLIQSINFLEKNIDYNLTYANVKLIKNQNKVIKKKLFKKKMPSGFIFKDILENYFLTIATVVIRNEFIIKNNLNFNNNFKIINDVDLFTRISYYSKIKYINDVCAIVRIHDDRLTKKYFFAFHDEHKEFLKTLKLMIPDFTSVYKKQISNLNLSFKYREGLLLWSKKEYSHARKNIFNSAKKNKKYYIVWFLTFFIEYSMFRSLFIKII